MQTRKEMTLVYVEIEACHVTAGHAAPFRTALERVHPVKRITPDLILPVTVGEGSNADGGDTTATGASSWNEEEGLALFGALSEVAFVAASMTRLYRHVDYVGLVTSYSEDGDQGGEPAPPGYFEGLRAAQTPASSDKDGRPLYTDNTLTAGGQPAGGRLVSGIGIGSGRFRREFEKWSNFQVKLDPFPGLSEEPYKANSSDLRDGPATPGSASESDNDDEDTEAAPGQQETQADTNAAAAAHGPSASEPASGNGSQALATTSSTRELAASQPADSIPTNQTERRSLAQLSSASATPTPDPRLRDSDTADSQRVYQPAYAPIARLLRRPWIGTPLYADDTPNYYTYDTYKAILALPEAVAALGGVVDPRTTPCLYTYQCKDDASCGGVVSSKLASL